MAMEPACEPDPYGDMYLAPDGAPGHSVGAVGGVIGYDDDPADGSEAAPADMYPTKGDAVTCAEVVK